MPDPIGHDLVTREDPQFNQQGGSGQGATPIFHESRALNAAELAAIGALAGGMTAGPIGGAIVGGSMGLTGAGIAALGRYLAEHGIPQLSGQPLPGQPGGPPISGLPQRLRAGVQAIIRSNPARGLPPVKTTMSDMSSTGVKSLFKDGLR